MKRVSFIPGVEGMSGILAGRAGKLVYPSNDNKAFDAPNGRQYARNYGSRIVLAQRKRDGLAYFACKTKSATLISAQSKTNMAILGSLRATLTAVKGMSTLYAAIKRVYDAHVSRADGKADGLTLDKFIEKGVHDMLKAKRLEWSDSVFIPGPPSTTVSFTMTNPYNLNGGQNQPQIKQSVWDKFVQFLAVDSNRRQNVLGAIKIDGVEILIPFSGATGTTMPTWAGVVGEQGSYLSPNYQSYISERGLSVAEGEDVMFNLMDFYKPTSQTIENATDTIIADTAYTTIRPESV